MPVDLFGKLCSVLVGIKDMEAAPVKGKPEWRSFDVGLSLPRLAVSRFPRACCHSGL
jgi:hypothetical protein